MRITASMAILALLLLSSLSLVRVNSEKKIAYVTPALIFDEFRMKKELEEQYKKVQIARQTYLDSIKLNIQSLSQTRGNANLAAIDASKRAYLIKENQFTKENENLYESYTDQIWKQINQYIEDYSKEQGYDYVLGAAGQGSLMYAKQEHDITRDVIKYINSRYEGRKRS